MKLTASEQHELLQLEALQESVTELMQRINYTRLEYLRAKKWHNRCINLKCRGYKGRDQDTVCPHCQAELAKTI